MANVRADVAALLKSSTGTITAPTTTVSQTSSQMKRDLGRGDDGDDVKALQEKLIKLGYDLGVWGADGDFGAATEAAVLDLQKKYGLTQDGMVGNTTMGIIDKLLANKTTILIDVIITKTLS